MEPPSFLASSEVSTVKKKKPNNGYVFRLDIDIYQTFFTANQLPGSEGVLRVVCGSCTIFVASNDLINALRFVF